MKVETQNWLVWTDTSLKAHSIATNMKLYLIFLAATSLVLGTGYATDNVEELLVNGNNQFTARMFNEVVKLNQGRSVVLSAFSVLTPLAQLSQASDGASHDQLLRAIGMPNDNDTKAAFSLLNTKMRAIPGVELKMASRVYVSENDELNPDFEAVSRDVFGTDVKNIDFRKSVEAAGAINEWVEEQTNKRIKNLVKPSTLKNDPRAILVNAIYFKGTWEHEFDPKNTADRDFYVTKEKVIKVPTMTRTGEYQFKYCKELDAKLVRLPYKEGKASMLIILPNEIEGLAALEEKLKDPSAIAKATENMFPTTVELSLPKFKIETTTNLKKVLQNIGVDKIFNPKDAQLTRLLKNDVPLYISEATQKAFIEVNEEGAEAAVANAFVAETLSIGPQVLHIKADHPFFFILGDDKYPIFSGVYQN